MLRRPLEAVRDRILGDLHRAGFTDTVCAHGTVLRYPGPDGRHPSELAEAAGVTRQAMNYTLGELEALGYTVRVPDPADGRAKLVMTTPRVRRRPGVSGRPSSGSRRSCPPSSGRRPSPGSGS